MTTELFDRVCETCQRFALFTSGAPALLMVSGGSDSTALVFVMLELAQRLELGAMRICHVNHMIRGEAADGDERFVAQLAASLGMGYCAHRIDIPALIAHGGNLEAVARRERYRIANDELDALCVQEGFPFEDGRIVVAHTQDDRVESFFMRAIVGTGPGGLASIAPVSGRVVRPLLDVSREDLRAYLRERAECEKSCQYDRVVPNLSTQRTQDSPEQGDQAVKQSEGSFSCADELWREDVTNEDTTHFRSFVRHKIVPVAKTVNPRLLDTLCNTMRLIGDEEALLDELATHEFEHLASTEELSLATITLDAAGLMLLPVPLQRRVVRKAALQVMPADMRLDSAHIEQIVQGAQDSGFMTLLPTGIVVANECGRLLFNVFDRDNAGASDSVAATLAHSGFTLAIPGEIDLGRAGILRATWAEDGFDVTSATKMQAFIDVGECRELFVTGVREGDRICPLGMGGHGRKVADVLVDCKVPKRMRSLVVAVRDPRTVNVASNEQGSIVWLAGLRTSESYKVTSRTVHTVFLSIEGSKVYQDV